MIFTLKINNSITCLKTPFFHHVSCNDGNHFVCTFYTGGGGGGGREGGRRRGVGGEGKNPTTET